MGKLIELSATQVVLYRSAAAAVILFALLPGRAAVSKPLAVALVANGMLVGAHWILFFLAVKVANVSICMIGMATTSFWTALLEPILIRKVRFQWGNLLLGCVVIAAVVWIYRTETRFHYGLLVALVGAIVATLFSIINGWFAGRVHPQSVVMYEMAGAALFCGAALVAASTFGFPLDSDRYLPESLEWLWLAILVLAGTVLAYQIYVRLLDRLSVFTINFANNLEPVYGISLGALIFGDHELLGSDFYVGTLVILAAVIVQPWLMKAESTPRAE
nr:EamA family transporter [Rhodopirellula sp. JC639]